MTGDPISRLTATRVLPVVTIDDAASAPALAETLAEAGLPVIEITLRTDAALDAIRRASAEARSAIVGAGSVTSVGAAIAAIDAGARFLVSPGLDADVVRIAVERAVPMIPGVATATELQHAVNVGCSVVKLFPAELLGGPPLVEALSAVWRDVRFVPTGGISARNVARYLALTEVLAVGGSWMAPRTAIAAGDWTAIAAAASTAVRLAEAGS